MTFSKYCHLISEFLLFFLLSFLQYTGLLQSCLLISKEEGWQALWKGITPRLMRIMPGQAITFMIYENVSSTFVKFGFLS